MTERRNHRFRPWLVGLWLVAWGGPAFAAEAPLPTRPERWVTDEANFLSPPTRQALDARLQSYEQATGHQVLLWIGHTTGVSPVEDWATRAFASWKVGRRGLDDGVVLFILADDKKIRIEVGYGVEGSLPDARAASIIREWMVPRMQQGDRDGAAKAGVEGILLALGGGGAVAPLPVVRPQVGWGTLIVLALLAVAFLGFLITHPMAAALLLTTLASGRGRRGGGGGFGGGGFSGGGGRSGGGGATGGW